MDGTTVAVDLAEDVFEVATANRAGRILERKRLTRRQFQAFVDGLPAGITVVMEACGTAHYWGRRCQARGHHVQLLPVQYVKLYVRRNKTDRMDTEALLEAARCAGIQPVPVNTPEQQALQALHRMRMQWQRTRTARINALRGMLREHGIPMALGATTVLSRLPQVLEDAENGLPAHLLQALALVYDEVRALERRVKEIDRQLARVAAADPVAQRLLTIPGIGVITATALLGAVPPIHAFRHARHFASWLGLTPSARAVLLTAQRTLRGKGKGRPFSTGPSLSQPGAATTKRRSPLRTSWRESSGRCGAANRTSPPARTSPSPHNALVHGVLSENILIMA